MPEPVFELWSLVLSGVWMLWAPFTIAFAYRIYTDEQRSRASGLYHLYLFAVVCGSIVGTASLVWIVANGLPTIWYFNLLTLVPLPVVLIQWQLHRAMDYTGWLGTA